MFLSYLLDVIGLIFYSECLGAQTAVQKGISTVHAHSHTSMRALKKHIPK